MTYISAADAAKTIRTNLKKLYGITSRQVSVRSDSFSGGSSIDIAINDPAVDAKEVKNLANGHESISRCEASGEILSGCNRYVSVGYSSKAADAEYASRKEFWDNVAKEFAAFDPRTGNEFGDIRVMKGDYCGEGSVAIKDPSCPHGGFYSATRFCAPSDPVRLVKAIVSSYLYHKGVN